jgi:DEAD/DEAH box helicase domain-containing protein
VHVHDIAPRAAVYRDPALQLSGPVVAALAARGIHQLFSHQAAAVEVLLGQGDEDQGQQQQGQGPGWQQQQGPQHCVIATSTASGKSLCYMVPMLEALARNRQVGRVTGAGSSTL